MVRPVTVAFVECGMAIHCAAGNCFDLIRSMINDWPGCFFLVSIFPPHSNEHVAVMTVYRQAMNQTKYELFEFIISENVGKASFEPTPPTQPALNFHLMNGLIIKVSRSFRTGGRFEV